MKHTDLHSLATVLFERFYADWKTMPTKEFLSYIATKTEQALGIDELEKRIQQKKRLTVKFGIDPTGPDVHMGHLLPIVLLRQFQKAGHKIELILGDFTARIGDPSGRNDQRPALSEKDIKNNVSTYLKQIGTYLDVKAATVHSNSRWLGKLKFGDILKDLLQLNLSELLQRQDFRSRLEEGYGLSVGELLYSYAQGMDSVALNPDVEVGGKDQFLNFAHARTIMQLHEQDPEIAITTPVLEGTSGDGRKMSKSYGNYIALQESNKEKFGKLMSIPDSLIVQYLLAFADIKQEEVNIVREWAQSNPLETKKQLAQFIVAVARHSVVAGQEEREAFEKTFSKQEFDETTPTIKATLSETVGRVLEREKVTESKSELRRLFSQGAIRMIEPEEIVLQQDDKIQEGILRVGKKQFFRVIAHK